MKIGIIITSYNDQGELEKCINSICALRRTSHPQIELVVVAIDDFSMDDSFLLLQKYKNQKTLDFCMRNDSNKGVSFSRNRGIEYCKDTEYLTFLDADDTINLDFINVFEKNLWADLILCNFSYVGPKTNMRSKKTFFKDDQALSHKQIMSYLSAYYSQPNRHSLLTTCWGKFYKTATLIAQNKIFFKERMLLCEDTEFVHRFLSNQQGGVQFLNNSFYEHSVSEGNRNLSKATFGANIALSNQLSFIPAVLASKPYMIKNGVDKYLLHNQILHCFGAYLMIYSIRSCMQIKTFSDFFSVSEFWRKIYNKPLFRRAMLGYCPKVAKGSLLLPWLINNRYYLFAIIYAYFICWKRYFSQLK